MRLVMDGCSSLRFRGRVRLRKGESLAIRASDIPVLGPLRQAIEDGRLEVLRWFHHRIGKLTARGLPGLVVDTMMLEGRRALVLRGVLAKPTSSVLVLDMTHVLVP